MRNLRFSVALCLAFAGLGFTGTAHAQENSGSAAIAPSAMPPLWSQIQKCFLPSTEATGRVVVAFDANDKGEVSGAHVVVGGTTDGEKALAAAGIRAILRCSPYQLRQAGEVRVDFEMPRDAPDSAGNGAGGQTPAENGGAAKPEAVYDPARQRSGTLNGVSFRFEVPEGFCALYPKANKFDAYMWTHFKPPKQRNAELVALDMDCETLAEGRKSGKVLRPKRLFMLAGAKRDADLPPAISDFLAALHARFVKLDPLTERFWQDPPVEGSPVVGLDEYAVYLAQRSLNKDGSIAVAGMTAFTLSHDRQLILTRMEFGGRNLTGDMPGRMMRVVKSLQDLSK